MTFWQLRYSQWGIRQPYPLANSWGQCTLFFFLFFFLIFFFNLFIYFWLCWVFGSCEGFLQLRQVGATLHRGAGTALHRGARAPHYRGPSRCGAQTPDAQAQQLWLTDPAAPRHVGSSQTRARTRVPCISRQILNHCATREALYSVLCQQIFREHLLQANSCALTKGATVIMKDMVLSSQSLQSSHRAQSIQQVIKYKA